MLFFPSFSIVQKSEQKDAQSGELPVGKAIPWNYSSLGSILVFLGSSGKVHFVNINALSFALARNGSVLSGISDHCWQCRKVSLLIL